MKKTLLWLDRYAEASVMGLMLALITIFMAMQVILRYCFHSSLIWVEEVIVYFNVWIGFLGISYCVRYKSDMRIDVSGLVPAAVSRWLRRGSDFILFVAYVYLGTVGIKVVGNFYRTDQRSPAARIPMFLVYGALLCGCVLATLRFLQRVYLFLREKGRGETK